MIKTKENNYRKAYTELNEIFKLLPKNQLEKIPESFIKNVQKEMDIEYGFKLDETKNLEEQDLMVETRALIVEIYERYLSGENEKETWKKYDEICLKEIEEKKRKKYNPDNIFEQEEKVVIEKGQIIEEGKGLEILPEKLQAKHNLLEKIMEKIKKIFFKEQ